MSAGEDVDGREPCALLVGMDMGADTVDTSMQVPLKIKNRSAIQPSNLTSGYLPEGNGITTLKRYLGSDVHCSFIGRTETWKQLKCPSVCDWMMKIYVTWIECIMGKVNVCVGNNIGILFSYKKGSPVATTWWTLRTLC